MLGYDRLLAARVASAFATELERALKKKAKMVLGLRSVSDAPQSIETTVPRY